MSEPMVWNSGFSVGNETLDTQHQQLLKLCAEATACLDDTSEEGAERVHDVLNDMARYAEQHFKTEEALLSKLGYPKLEQQRAEHFGYVVRLNELLDAAMEQTLDRKELSQYLWAWWSHHILESDMQFSKFLSGKN